MLIGIRATIEALLLISFIFMNKGTSWIIAAAVISFLLAIYVWFTGNQNAGIFIGLWVPSLLALATYFKK